MSFVYVLRNRTSGYHYTGHNADLTQRLGQHNHGFSFFFNDTATTEIYSLSLHDALPISMRREKFLKSGKGREELNRILMQNARSSRWEERRVGEKSRSRGSAYH